MDFTGLLDMINGGGAGKAGNQFEGGAFSGLLNSMGVKPRGYYDRIGATRPQARPEQQQAPQQQAPQPMPTQQAPQPSYGGQGGTAAGMMAMGPQTRPNNGPGQMPMGPQNGRPNNGPEPQYSGRGQVGMPLPPGLNLSPEDMEIVNYLRQFGKSPF